MPDAGEAEYLHWLGDRDGDGDLVAVDGDGAGIAGCGQVGTRRGLGLVGIEGDLPCGAEQGQVDGLSPGAGGGLGFVYGFDPRCEEEQGEGEDDDEGGDHPRLAAPWLRWAGHGVVAR